MDTTRKYAIIRAMVVGSISISEGVKHLMMSFPRLYYKANFTFHHQTRMSYVIRWKVRMVSMIFLFVTYYAVIRSYLKHIYVIF